MQDKDELSQMAGAVIKLVDGLKLTSTFADEVGKGNFHAPFTPLSEADMLGNALIKMNHNLKGAAEEDSKRTWASEGIARFSEILRSGTDLSILAEKIISGLVKYLQANQGGLFMVHETNGQAPELELLACYAYDRKKYIEKKVSAGEGLLGQAYLEKEKVYITQLPDNYLQISSGLGDGTPKCLLIVPMKIQDKVEGVLEIASFTEFQEHEISFVEKLAESIASSIAAVKINARTQKLLQDSQQQSEELRAQEEEMRQNMEELIATQEEMKRKEREYLAMLEEAKYSSADPVHPSVIT
jgi:transcriptional regulator with GAF, ATPase, and Fis domain